MMYAVWLFVGVLTGFVLCALLSVDRNTTYVEQRWRRWHGGPDFIPTDVVLVRFRDGRVGQGPATDWSWKHYGEDDDIIAYTRIRAEGVRG